MKIRAEDIPVIAASLTNALYSRMLLMKPKEMSEEEIEESSVKVIELWSALCEAIQEGHSQSGEAHHG